MPAKFKVGDDVRLKASMCYASMEEYADKITTITEVKYGQFGLTDELDYRYKISLDDDDPRNLWHPLYFELLPPTPKHRRIRL